MIAIESKEIWFITGSQHLYGPETLEQVAKNSKEIVEGLDASAEIPVKIVYKDTVKTEDEIAAVMREANNSEKCIGLVAWMHTFSPAKMWIKGLTLLGKPICHLHTQFNAEVPWSDIDMDFMNLNQSAHGDREFGFMMSRMRKKRKVIVGHWKSDRVQKKLGIWSREGDKVEAQMKFGVSVNAYDSSDIVAKINEVTEDELNKLLDTYATEYNLTDSLKEGGEKRQSLIDAAKIELGLRKFLEEGGFKAFTDTFENLGELKQLPGLAVQRLMADGYGFGGEGDWKTAALTRVMKVMAQGLEGGTSFMEDYTYHFTPEKSLVMGSHMLEICPSIADAKPSCEVHPLGIGGKEDPVRLVFNSPVGDAINATLVDMGNRFRIIVNEVEAVAPEQELPKLPVARVLWDCKPDLEVAATAWILAGGAHHTVYTQALTTEYMEDFADIAGVELLVIDEDTKVRSFKDTINANEAYYHLFQHKM